MLDHYNRNIDYLRISVTDKCNLRCTYCMPKEGVKLLPHNEILSFEEIVEFARAAIAKGITKIRLTGGEPLVRKGIVNLVKMLSGLEGLEDLSMTSNGTLLKKYAKDLANAGLKRINISLDTTNPEQFCSVTRNGDIQDVFNGIDAAIEAGLSPIKINCVLLGQPDGETKKLQQFCKEKGLSLRFIHQMDLETGDFSVIQGGDGGNCSKCNRIRLLANGDVKPCLFSDLAYNTRALGAEKAIDLAIGNKPKAGTYNKSKSFSQIGG